MQLAEEYKADHPERICYGDDRELLATYGKKVDFTNKTTIKPLLSFLES